jgi:hypothetical protein
VLALLHGINNAELIKWYVGWTLAIIAVIGASVTYQIYHTGYFYFGILGVIAGIVLLVCLSKIRTQEAQLNPKYNRTEKALQIIFIVPTITAFAINLIPLHEEIHYMALYIFLSIAMASMIVSTFYRLNRISKELKQNNTILPNDTLQN